MILEHDIKIQLMVKLIFWIKFDVLFRANIKLHFNCNFLG